MTEDSTNKNNKYFCKRCKDQNYLIECKCGCGEIIPRCNKFGYVKEYKHGHNSFGNNHPRYKGITKDVYGYNIILVGYKTRKKHHRLVYEEYYNCCLLPKTVVHHKNKIKDDNRIENLQLFTTNNEHISFENKKDMSDWFCNLCGTKKTRISKHKNGKLYENWHNDIDGHLCNLCYIHIKNFRKRMGL